MKMLGLLGGMSWESSIEYERAINQAVRRELGGTASADLVIRSFNFAEIEALQNAGKWEQAGNELADAAMHLYEAGAKAIVICTNTMHVLADQIQARLPIPLIHIADATGAAVTRAGVKKVLLLGTRYTMEKDFLRGRLAHDFGLNVTIPEAEQRDEIHRIIFEELVQGKINQASKNYLLGLIAEYSAQGIDGVIAGCTEIELLVHPDDLAVPYFPTSAIHSAAAAEFMLS
jgi:aspartate racemase